MVATADTELLFYGELQYCFGLMAAPRERVRKGKRERERGMVIGVGREREGGG